MKVIHKKMSKLIFSLMIVVIGLLITPITSSATQIKNHESTDIDTMEVHFIDVGQGDSTLITCGEHSMLIDTGDDSKGTLIQNYLTKQGVKNLDYLILTHPDADHIGGAPVVITKFSIDKVFVSNYAKDNKTYQKLIQSLDNKRLKYETPKVGSQYSLGTATITILAPNDEYSNPNDASIALLVQNGNNKFLFTGDAGEEAEEDILDNKIDISADVYKVAHHGSKYSSSKNFLKAVNPTYAVISCGEGNSYGHPHAETLNTLRTNKIKVYRTDEDGTIIATSDGKNITFNVPASETWKSGEATNSSTKQQNSSQVQNKQTQESANKENVTAVIEQEAKTSASDTTEITYVLNVKTKKFHRPTCGSLPTTNRQDTSESRDSIIAQGYEACKKCKP